MYRTNGDIYIAIDLYFVIASIFATDYEFEMRYKDNGALLRVAFPSISSIHLGKIFNSGFKMVLFT